MSADASDAIGATPMWVWSLNWNMIRPDIVLGSCPMTADDLDRLRKEANITATLSLQHDECYARLGIDYAEMRRRGTQSGLDMARCPVRDFDVADMRRRLATAVGLLDALLRARRRVYVHCTAGTGRSPLVVLAYLALMEDYDADAALALLRARRPGIGPSVEAYAGCRQDLVERHRERVSRRAGKYQAAGVAAAKALPFAEAEILREVIREGLMVDAIAVSVAEPRDKVVRGKYR
jgi:hypothetical protein